jgi:hypothetical protein
MPGLFIMRNNWKIIYAYVKMHYLLSIFLYAYSVMHILYAYSVMHILYAYSVMHILYA